jgi:hypothetical protein
MFLAVWSGLRLNLSRTKPIDRDQRRYRAQLRANFRLSEAFALKAGKKVCNKK